MIFLLQNGTYRYIKHLPGDVKFAKKYAKYKDSLAAILVECFSLLHSDTYTIVLPEHFKSVIEPFDITYTISFSSIDEPVGEANSLTRTLHIEDAMALYNAATLIRQLEKNDEVITRVGGYDVRTISLLEVVIHNKGKVKARWPGVVDETASSFVAEYDLVCDTDKFLDAAVPKSARIEMGCYYTRFDRKSMCSNIEYHYYDRKAILYLTGDKWCIDVIHPQNFRKADSSEQDPYFARKEDLLRATHVRNTIRETDPCFAGICINGTGLLYMCVLPEAIGLHLMDSFEISLDIREESINGEIPFDTEDKWGMDYMAANYLETLYLGLYIPQMLELERFLFSQRIRAFSCEFIHNRRQTRNAYYVFPDKLAGDQSVEFDLLAVMAKILLTTPPSDIGLYE